MKVLDLFSGIGGFSLGLERAGMETVAFCEIEPYCRKLLKKHWPDVPIYGDVKNVTAKRLRADGIFPDVVTGGFPCQDISLAGKQAGIEGERSGLWGELARIIGDIRPKYAIVENVTALISGDRGRWFGRVLGDLAEIGYDAEWHCIPASELGAHHHRDRVWIIAYPNRDGIRQQSRRRSGASWEGSAQFELYGAQKPMAYAGSNRSQERMAGQNTREKGITRVFNHQSAARLRAQNGGALGTWATEPNVGRVANGIPRRVDRLTGLGNAVVPQIPEIIGRAIMQFEDKKT